MVAGGRCNSYTDTANNILKWVCIQQNTLKSQETIFEIRFVDRGTVTSDFDKKRKTCRNKGFEIQYWQNLSKT